VLRPAAKATVGSREVVHPHRPLLSITVPVLAAVPVIFAPFFRVFLIKYIAMVNKIEELAISRKIRYMGTESMNALPPWMYARYQNAKA
jgi:hypothetical protein